MERNNTGSKPHIIILGAGPAGLGAAYQLAVREIADVTVIEQNERVGGNAASFEVSGLHVDYGSHRLHPACDPIVFQDIQSLLGDDLLNRPRHGRIRLRQRWIHFPLKPWDLALRLPPGFAAGVIGDSLGKLVNRDGFDKYEDNFAVIMERGLGKTICQDFYFPYARKIWGLDPAELSGVQAQRRVSNNSLGKMVKKVLSAVPGLKPKGSGRFYYPRNGYGQISEGYYHAAENKGAQIYLKSRVQSVLISAEDDLRMVEYKNDGQVHQVSGDYIWSTIPITVLSRILNPSPPKQLIEAAQAINYRAMILVYVVIAQERFSEYDAHYFPEVHIPITRLSEPKNYSQVSEPANRTLICAELPCEINSKEWNMDETALGELISTSLETAGIPIRAPVLEVQVRRIPNAYPIYRLGYEQYFNDLDNWIEQIDGLLTFGRQGLFAHDNTHHALYMAYSAVNCLDDQGGFDRERWGEYRKLFETHVVED